MLYDCCRAFYAPSNLVLAAAGNITAEQVLEACARAGLDQPAAEPAAQRIWADEPMTLVQTEKDPAYGGSKALLWGGIQGGTPGPRGRAHRGAVRPGAVLPVRGMSGLYRRLYDQGLVNPGFGGEVLRVDGCCCILFTGESDQPDTVRQLLLEEIERIRSQGVDREIFTLCKNEKYGQLVENLENVEDAASQMADFALLGQTVAQQIEMLAGLTAEDADRAMQGILRPERMAYVKILPGDAGAGTEEE